MKTKVSLPMLDLTILIATEIMVSDDEWLSIIYLLAILFILVRWARRNDIIKFRKTVKAQRKINRLGEMFGWYGYPMIHLCHESRKVDRAGSWTNSIYDDHDPQHSPSIYIRKEQP